MESIVVIILLSFILIMMMVEFWLSYSQRKQEFEIKLTAAETARNSHIVNMNYKDLLSIVDTNMIYYVDQEILLSGILNKKSDEEKSINFNNILISICSKVETSLSNDVKEALLFFITEEHFRTYIKDSSRVLLIAKIEQKNFNK